MKKFIVYKITHISSKKIYVGVHTVKNGEYDDNYYGSGKYIKRAVKKHGKEAFKKELLYQFNNAEDAYKKEFELVSEIFSNNIPSYNIASGGIGGRSDMVCVRDEYNNVLVVRKDQFDPKKYSGVAKGSFVVEDSKGKKYRVDKQNEKYLSGELIPTLKGRIVVSDSNGKKSVVSKLDPRVTSGELVSINSGKIVAKDSFGNKFKVFLDDPRLKSGELVGQLKGSVVVKDKHGNKFTVSKEDPRFKSGELVGIASGKVPVIDKFGNKFSVSKEDPRLISGELNHVTKNTATVKDKNGNVFRVSKDDPRIKSGELVGISKNTIRITNGIVNKIIDANLEIPDGFRRGVTR